MLELISYVSAPHIPAARLAVVASRPSVWHAVHLHFGSILAPFSVHFGAQRGVRDPISRPGGSRTPPEEAREAPKSSPGASRAGKKVVWRSRGLVRSALRTRFEFPGGLREVSGRRQEHPFWSFFTSFFDASFGIIFWDVFFFKISFLAMFWLPFGIVLTVVFLKRAS